MVVTWAGGRRENGELLFNRDRISVLQGEKNTGDRLWQWLYNIINVLSKTELYTYNMVKMVNFIFYHNKKIGK